jgi:tRNA A37 threonylcarbamoyladenosine dehydratase
MKQPISLAITNQHYQKLCQHLFPGDGDEHGAILVAGIAESSRGTRLLVREVFLARDGLDYVPSKRGYRALSTDFVARMSDYCAVENLCYLAVHNHGGTDYVDFSQPDIASHERGYPALLDITNGGPVGALVFARNDIWTPEKRHKLDFTTILGSSVFRMYPSPISRPPKTQLIYDRHARLFGDIGQQILSQLKVGVIGVGGGGSLLNEWLARLGVGYIAAVDYQRVDLTNLPRIVGATRWDALAPFAESKFQVLKKIAKTYAIHKVHVAERVAKQANPRIRYQAIVGSVLNEDVARTLSDADFLFLATDTIQSRLVFNALVYQYMIPGMQIGVKVTTSPHSGMIEDIIATTRPVTPQIGGGCLLCNSLIPPDRLTQEAQTEEEQRAQHYIDDEMVKEPSVITLNALSAAQAANDFMMMFTGLYKEGVELKHILHDAQIRETNYVEARFDESCLLCGSNTKSKRARGDRSRLPCYLSKNIK